MSDKKKPSMLFPLILIGLVISLLGAYAVFLKMNPPHQKPLEQAPAIAKAPATPSTQTKAPEPTAAEQAVVVPTKVLTGPAPEPSIPVAKSSDPKVEEMMTARKVGSDAAPIKVVEYSSLTCGHCAAFHQNDFPRLKSDYIDTGKVQFIFKEFPLNKQAIDASKLLRCLPPERFESFMALLFAEQQKWAYQQDYLTPLKQDAKLAGLSDEAVASCLANTELENRIVGDMKAGTEKYKIESTPSFVINDGLKTIIGHQPYGFFKETFDGLLGTASPSATSAEKAPAPAQEAAPATPVVPNLVPTTPDTKVETAPETTPATTPATK